MCMFGCTMCMCGCARGMLCACVIVHEDVICACLDVLCARVNVHEDCYVCMCAESRGGRVLS